MKQLTVPENIEVVTVTLEGGTTVDFVAKITLQPNEYKIESLQDLIARAVKSTSNDAVIGLVHKSVPLGTDPPILVPIHDLSTDALDYVMAAAFNWKDPRSEKDKLFQDDGMIWRQPFGVNQDMDDYANLLKVFQPHHDLELTTFLIQKHELHVAWASPMGDVKYPTILGLQDQSQTTLSVNLSEVVCRALAVELLGSQIYGVPVSFLPKAWLQTE